MKKQYESPLFSAVALGCFFSVCNWASIAHAQELETPPPPKSAPRPEPYLAPGTIDYMLLLPPPPGVGSLRDQTDVAVDKELERDADAERWKAAVEDGDYVYYRFADAFGRPIRRVSLPRTLYLLNRAIQDVVDPTFRAKKAFHRPRPFQRYQLSRMCEEERPPAPEVNPTTGSSYPSGHSAYGWTTALVLAEVAPDRASQLLQEAEDYGQSRLICGMHFSSDVEAGRAIAEAVVQKLHDSGAFRHDLLCAQAEYKKRVIPSNCPVR